MSPAEGLAEGGGLRSVDDMNDTQSNAAQNAEPNPPVLPRPRPRSSRPDVKLAIGLGSLTLLSPILNIATHLLRLEDAARLPVNAWLWLVIGMVWILAGWLTRTPQPVLTLFFTGMAGGVFTAVLVIVIQLFGSGGPGLAAAPIAIVSILAMHAVGGVLSGLIAWGLQSATAGAAR